MRRSLARFIHHYPAYTLAEAAFLPLGSFRFLMSEMDRHEAEALRQMVWAHFVKEPRELLNRIESALSDEDEVSEASSSAQIGLMLANLPSDMVALTSRDAISQRVDEAFARQAEMDAAIASGDVERIREVMRRQQASG